MDLRKLMYDIHRKYFTGKFSRSFKDIEDLKTNLKNDFEIDNDKIVINNKNIIINCEKEQMKIEIVTDDNSIRIEEPIIESLTDSNYYFKD